MLRRIPNIDQIKAKALELRRKGHSYREIASRIKTSDQRVESNVISKIRMTCYSFTQSLVLNEEDVDECKKMDIASKYV